MTRKQVPPAATSTTNRPARWRISRRTFLWTAALLSVALIGCFAPTLICLTPLRNVIAQHMFAGFEGSITIDRARLGWLSPVMLEGVTIRDGGGGDLATAKRIAGAKTLLALIAQPDCPGSFRIAQPVVHVQLLRDGSNLEEAFAGLLRMPSTGTTIRQLSIAVEGGSADIVDRPSGQSWALRDVTGQFGWLEGQPRAGGQIAGALAAGNKEAGRFRVTLAAPAADGTSKTQGDFRADVQLHALPASLANPVFRRLGQSTRVAATLTGRVGIGWDYDGRRFSVKASPLRVDSMKLSLPDRLREETLELAELVADGSIGVCGRQIDADKLIVSCDLGRLEASGKVDLTNLRSVMDAPQSDNGLTVQLDTDLARLADRLPRTIRLRRDVELTGGKLVARASYRRDDNQPRLLIDVCTNDLVGRRGGRAFTLHQPLRVRCALRPRQNRTATGGAEPRTVGAVALSRKTQDGSFGNIELEFVKCESAFLHLDGRGDLERGRLSLRGDLTQLMDQLRQFVDTEGMRGSGRIHTDIEWGPGNRPAEPGRLVQENGVAPLTGLTCRAKLTDIDTQLFGWTCAQTGPTELRLDMSLSARHGTIESIQDAALVVRSGNDALRVELEGPLTTPLRQSAPEFAVSVSGGIRHWLDRLALSSLLGSTGIDGHLVAHGRIRSTREWIAVDGLNCRIKDFALRHRELEIKEPEVAGTVSARWDLVRGELTTGQSTLTSSTVAARSDAGQLRFGGGRVQSVSGRVTYRADLKRIQDWYRGETPPRFALRGMLEGQASLDSTGSSPRVRWAAHIDRLELLLPPGNDQRALAVLASASGRQWRSVYDEQRVELSGDAVYNLAACRADFKSLQVESDAVSLKGNGAVQIDGGKLTVDIAGQMATDMEKLSRKLQHLATSSISFSGKRTQPFALAGAWVPPDARSAIGGTRAGSDDSNRGLDPMATTAWTIRTGMGWTAGSVYGLMLGPADVSVELSGREASLGPTTLPVNGGTFRGKVRIVFETGRPVLVLDESNHIEQVELTRDICREWMLYVAPIVAQATESRGRVSVVTDGARLPLADPLAGAASGSVEIHEGLVGPGPLGRQLIWLVDRVRAVAQGRPFAGGGTVSRTWLQLPQQKVNFRLTDRRVFHDHLAVQIGDVAVQTSGSVGADQSLDLVAVVPIQEAWVRGRRFAQGLKGASVAVPIRGTIKQPRLDETRLQEFARRLVEQAAGQALQDELIRGIDRFLGSGR